MGRYRPLGHKSTVFFATLRKLGPGATATQIRDYIENTHGQVGIYDFGDGNRRGFALNAARLATGARLRRALSPRE